MLDEERTEGLSDPEDADIPEEVGHPEEEQYTAADLDRILEEGAALAEDAASEEDETAGEADAAQPEDAAGEPGAVPSAAVQGTGAGRKGNRGRRRLWRIIGIVAGVVLLLILALVLYVNSKLNMINYHQKSDEIEVSDIVIPAEDQVEIDVAGLEEREGMGDVPEGDVFSDKNVVNILLIGSDKRIPNTLDKGRADATMLLSLNKVTGAIKLISFERGISVPIPGHGYDQLNHSFNYGGAELTTQIVRECFLLDVVGYAHVDFETFADAIDAIGGVDVELTAVEAAALNGEWATNARTRSRVVEGLNHLDGYDALQFARERYTDSDWERVRRQRDVIQAVINKTKGLSVTELNDMINAVLPHINTDLTKAEIVSLMLEAPRFMGVQAEQLTIPDKEHLWVATGDYVYKYGCDFQWCADTIREFIYGEETA